MSAGLAALGEFAQVRAPMAVSVEHAERPAPRRSVYRVAGSLTIARAATTQREIDALPDPLTIDLSEVEKMDTVGAWIIYRTVRDRGAKVVGASPDDAEPARRRSPKPTSRPRSGPKSRRRCPVLERARRMDRRAGRDPGRPARLLRRRPWSASPRSSAAQAVPRQRRRPALRRGRRAGARHHRPDELPDRHRRRPAGRGPARAVRRRNLHHQPDRPDHGPRARHADDRDHGRRPLGIGLRGADRDDEDHRGDRRDAHHRRVADRGAGHPADDRRRSS